MTNTLLSLVLGFVLGFLLCTVLFPQKEVQVYKNMRQTVIETKTDTVVVEVPVLSSAQLVIKPVKSSERSIIDTTIAFGEVETRLQLTTHPAIDSIKIQVDVLSKDKIITVTDTIYITQIDSVFLPGNGVISGQSVNEQPWYDSFEVGALAASAILVAIFYIK